MDLVDLIALSLALFISAVLGYLTNVLHGKSGFSLSGRILLLLFASLISAGMLMAYEFITSQTKRVEGVWVEGYVSKGVKVYAVGFIYTDHLTNSLHYDGAGYDSSGKNIAAWESERAMLENNVLGYFYTGQSFRAAETFRHTGGSGTIRFSKDYATGDGYFASEPEDTIPRPFRVFRLTDEDMILLAETNPAELVRRMHGEGAMP